MAKVTCIDVSYCQTGVDYNKVKATGITAVIIRAGYGRETSQKDTQFETHYKNAKAAGLKIGAYWYSYADSVADAKKEAAACLACIKGKTFDMPIYYDMEESSQTKLGKTTLTSMAKSFCEAIKAGGYRAGIYSNLNWLNNYLDYATLKKSYSIWLAQWSSSNSLSCDIWQNSSTGKINGISGNVDTNIIFNNSIFGSTTTSTDSTSKTATSATTSTAATSSASTSASSSVKAGKKLTLSKVPLYASSTSTVKANTLTGTYYLWDAAKTNNRYRITNSTSNVGKSGQVTGWIDSKYVV